LAALAQARSGRQQLKEVPLAYCEIDPVLLERLANMGIYTLGPLLDLPQADLGQRFGAAIINYLERLTGEAPDPREAIIPPERFSSTLHLLDPVTDKDALLFPMKRLLVELHHWLVSHQLGAEQLNWRFAPFDDASAVVMPVRSARARQSQQAFLDISKLRLEQIDVPEVMSVSLSSSRLVAWNNVSSGLFDQQPKFAAPVSNTHSSAHNALTDLIDHLNARLGSEACRSIQIADQHAPELAWQSVEPLSGNRSAVTSPAAALPATRPTWLFEPPRKVIHGFHLVHVLSGTG
jgi:protein ImuB